MASDTIDFDVACVRCEYNLRGMAAGAACPECGHRVLDSIAEHLRRRAPTRVDHVRLAERPASTLRSLRDGGIYAVVANGLAATWIFVQPSIVYRRDPVRYVMLAITCVAIACAAMSIWRLAVPPHRPSRGGTIARWLIRIGALASIVGICHATFTHDRITFGNYRSFWPGDTNEYAAIALAWATALGIALRAAYAQWWLRLEGRSLVAWPLIFAALPTIFFFAVYASFGYRYRGDFISFEFISEQPLTSHAWPIFYAEGRRELLRRLDFWPMAFFGFLLLGHVVVIVADWTLARLASKALRKPQP